MVELCYVHYKYYTEITHESEMEDDLLSQTACTSCHLFDNFEFFFSNTYSHVVRFERIYVVV